MMKKWVGFIINVFFIVGIIGNVGQLNYVVLKVGIIGFFKFIVKELGLCNVCCNVIVFGFIVMDMIDEFDEKICDVYFVNILLCCFGEGIEVVDVCVFLVLDMSSYVFGQVLSVCGVLNIQEVGVGVGVGVEVKIKVKVAGFLCLVGG